MLVQNVLKSDNRRLSKRILLEQQEEDEDDDTLYETTRRTLRQYDIDINKVAEMRKSELKKKVKAEIGKDMNRMIQKAAENMTKMRFMKGETFGRKKYVDEMSGHESLKVIKTRLNMQPVYKNFKANVKLVKECPYCVQYEDSTEHLIQCKAVGRSMLTSEDLKDTEDIQLWKQLNERISFNIENRKNL